MSKGARKHVPEESRAQSAATIPVPPSGRAPVRGHVDALDTDRDVPSGRPTTVPSYDVEALAAASSWENQLPERPVVKLPLDLAVPVRKRASADGAPLRAAFLLSHVDDRMSIAEIAESAQIPIADAIECFVLLGDLGVVELRSAAAPIEPPDAISEGFESGPVPSKSGLRPKT
jgi:hypothetical protein